MVGALRESGRGRWSPGGGNRQGRHGRPARRGRRDGALVSVVNFLLAMSLLATGMGTVATVWDPELIRRAEAEHGRQVERQLSDVATGMDRLALGGRVNSTIRQGLDLGSESRGLLTAARTYGSIGLGPGGGPLPGLNVSASLSQPRASQSKEGPMLPGNAPTGRIIAGGDRGNPASLSRFEVRITDVSRLTQDGSDPTFRVAVLKAGVCHDPSCPQLQLSPVNRGLPTDYQNKVIWIGSFARTKSGAQDAVSMTLWARDGAASTAWSNNGEKASNVETINLLCDEATPGVACPAPRPRSLLEPALQLWPMLFRQGAGVPGEQYDVWIVNGDRVYGTYGADGAPPGAVPGFVPGTYPVPIPTLDQPLEVSLTPRHTPSRTLRLEHGALLSLEDGGRGSMVAPPPFAFRPRGPGVVEATLRIHALAGSGATMASSQGASLGLTLARQVPVDGTAGILALSLPTASCDAWIEWFRGAMAEAALTEGTGYTSSCDPAAGRVNLVVHGPVADPGAQDLRVSILWTGFQVEVGV